MSNIPDNNNKLPLGEEESKNSSSSLGSADGSKNPDNTPAPNTHNIELSYKNWEDSKIHLRWDATPQGRAVIRLFSRGGLGAAAFAFGSWYAGRGVGMKGYHQDIKFSEISPDKPLQYIAKSIDVVFGKPIQATARFFGASDKKAQEMVLFRPTANITQTLKGRSLGHESVSITFDFFCSSVGDAIGRDIAGIMDSNVKHDWKDGAGHIKYTEASKTFAKSLWRYVSYNGGEDWAVAVPYAYFMRTQKNLIRKFSPGFNIDNERGLNGGSFKVNNEGKIIGNYNLEGMLDLQGRFTAYNIGTLMYREAYNHIANKIHGKKSALYGSLDDADKPKNILENAGDLFKWGARSAIKGTLYMTPVVPFFSIFRTPQSKYKGLFINTDDKAVLAYEKPDGSYDALHANEIRRSHGQFTDYDTTKVYNRRLDKGRNDFYNVGAQVTDHPLKMGSFDPYNQKEGNLTLNQIGKTQNYLRSKVNNIPQMLGFGRPSKRNMDNYINAAFAYTPYMYAKGEAARLWDTGKMDVATERMINGATSLNLEEFKAGASEVWQSVLHKPFNDQKREAEAQKRIFEDLSPADNLTKEQGLISSILQRSENQPISWKERIIHNNERKNTEKQKPEKQYSFLEQEEMRKALRELHPPTNSVH